MPYFKHYIIFCERIYFYSKMMGRELTQNKGRLQHLYKVIYNERSEFLHVTETSHCLLSVGTKCQINS